MEWFLDWVTRIWTLSHYRMVLFIRNDKQDKLFTIGALIYGLWVEEWLASHSPYTMRIQEYGGYQLWWFTICDFRFHYRCDRY